MRNESEWKPSKFIFRNGRWQRTSDRRELTTGSRLIAQLVVTQYEQYLAQFAHGHLIDLGCGKVPFYGLYKNHVTRITCADWPQTIHTSHHVDVFCNLNQPLPFADETFDTVILSDVLEHLAAPHLALAEIARILRPGGVVFLNTPFFYWLHETPHDYYRYTEYALRKLLHDAGLDCVVLESLGGSPEILTDMIAKHLSTLPLFGSTVAGLCCDFAIWLRRLRPWRKFSQKTSSLFPFGYFAVAQKSPR